VIRVFFRSRPDIALEILALRQQVAVLNKAHRNCKYSHAARHDLILATVINFTKFLVELNRP
jgi:hypothetical protein